MAEGLIQMPEVLTAGSQPANSNFAPDVWGGVPFAPGQGGYNSLSNYGSPTGTGNGMPGAFQNISQGLGAFQSLASIYGMFQNLGLQKKAFKFAREGTKRNFNASATAFNNAIDDRNATRGAYAANNPDTDYGSMAGYGGGQKVEKWT